MVINLTSPIGGENWGTGTEHNITWNWSGTINNVTISIWKSSQWQSNIVVNITNKGSYSWKIPSNFVSGSDYSIKVEEAGNSSNNSKGNPFTISSSIPVSSILRGINWSGWEYNNAYGLSLQKLTDLKNNWNVNIIRFSFNRQDYMNNPSYSQHIRDAVNWCKSLSITSILDHEWESETVNLSSLPNKIETIALWSNIAQDPTYQNSPLVWFDIWDEPHDCTLSQWRDIADACATEIRKYSNNTILVAGIAWANDVSSWHGNYLTQSNIIYSRHNYGPAYGGTSPSDMDSQEGVLLKDGQQIFAGEIGCCDSPGCTCSQSAIDNIKNVLFPWYDGKNRGSGIPTTSLGFTAWSICDPPLLCNPPGNVSFPTNYGTVVQNELKINLLPMLNSITISPTSVSVNVGATQQLKSVCMDQNNNIISCPTLIWTSNDSSIATVDSSGLVTCIAAGAAIITTSAGGKTSNISTITVIPQADSKFNVYQLGSDGVTVVKSVNGMQTATQAIQAVTNILNKL